MQGAEDELAIRSLAAAYSDAVNRRDSDGMAAVYAPDGILDMPAAGKPIVGIERIRRRFRRLVEEEREFLFQMAHSGVVEIHGDRAQARWWFSELKKPSGGAYEYVLGVYQDEVARTDEGWRFARRTVAVLLRYELPEAEIPQVPLPPFLPITGLPRP